MTTIITKISLIAILFTLIVNTQTYAQTEVNDPLNKPELWEKILSTPKDMRLWAAYVGKDLNSLNEEDEKQIVTWCSNMKLPVTDLNTIANMEVWNEVADEHQYTHDAKIKMDLEYKVFHKLVQDQILQESPVIQDLQSNIEANFIIIEDMLRLEFEEFGTDFIDYYTAHPSDNYPKDKWLQEKNFELNELKILNLELLKAQLTSK